ncbi:Major intrinsic protein [Penicillium bovifimosum]|uniref:Major intrinsic protein n=1 Tax=Penicillium bovifimosum TaxID=126998 RepID=A0A9W9GLJ6_9EURO|nr:Major intrinsic protein [Penicillium bovifimosum]KAJ5123858.1 Major intrinsic protein [Penicillium bovifimosum]
MVQFDNGVFNEFIGIAFLTATILALGDDQNAPPGAGMNTLIIGLIIVCQSTEYVLCVSTRSGVQPEPRLRSSACAFRH